MFSRIITSAPLGVAVTAGLLMLMSALIESGPEAAISTTVPSTLTFLKPRPEEKVLVDEPIPERIDPPVPVPIVNSTATAENPGPTIPLQPAEVPGPGAIERFQFGPGNTSLVNVMKVRPAYPAKAQRLGLEGHVIVAYDVTGAGTVFNVRVVDSSNDIFNNEAIKAALRFRYSSRIVDGEPVATYGLMNKFIFAMEE